MPDRREPPEIDSEVAADLLEEAWLFELTRHPVPPDIDPATEAVLRRRLGRREP